MKDALTSIICSLYYEQSLTQKKIGKRFSISKMNVSRILQRARQENIIKVDIQSPFEVNEILAQKIEKAFSLNRCYILKPKTDKYLNESNDIAKFYAYKLGVLDFDNKIIGVGVGKTLGYLARNLIPMVTENIKIIQLMGGLQDVSFQNPFSIVQNICSKWSCKGSYIASPVIVKNSNIRENILSNSKNVQMWDKCDYAIFSVGAIGAKNFLFPSLMDKKETIKILEKGGVVDILGHVFNKDGNLVDSEIEGMLVSIPVDSLIKIKNRIAIVGGVEKTESLRAALKSGLINILVTSDNIGNILIEKNSVL